MHKRFSPKVNQFVYNSFYIFSMLDELADHNSTWFFGKERFGLMSFKQKDHGYKNTSSNAQWLSETLKPYNLKTEKAVGVITIPSVLGYVFNPITFWLVYNENKSLVTVVCEVNNTFGESHHYICHNETGITNKIWFSVDKEFHVSPFLNREGSYRFNFDIKSKSIKILINLVDNNNRLKLTTSLSGKLEDLTKNRTLKAFLSSPLMTFKIIFLIHYQAIKLLLKRIPFLKKPVQKKVRVSLAKTIIGDSHD